MRIYAPLKLSAVSVTMACLLLCACASVGPRRAECELHGGRSWREVKSNHFTLQTAAGSETAHNTLSKLEWTLNALLLMWDEELKPAAAIDVILVNRSEWEEFGEEWVAGKMLSSIPNPLIVLVGQSSLNDLAPKYGVVAHELTHYLLRHVFVQTPLWFEEGFAQFMETVTFGLEPGTVVFGRPDIGVLRYNQEKAPLPLSALWEWGKAPMSKEERIHCYASSFAWFHYLYNHEEKRFGHFWQGLAKGTKPREAWQQAFADVSEDALYISLKRYLDGGKYEDITYRMAKKTTKMTERTMAPAEVHLLRAKLLLVGSKMGSQKELSDHVRRELSTAVTIDPEQVEARASLIWWDEDPKRQHREAKKLVEAYPDNIDALKVLIHVQQKIGDKEQLEENLLRALKVGPQDPFVLRELALLRANSGETEVAIRHVESALKAAPWDPWTLGACALATAASGECDEAERLKRRALSAFKEETPPQIREELKTRLAPIHSLCSPK